MEIHICHSEAWVLFAIYTPVGCTPSNYHRITIELPLESPGKRLDILGANPRKTPKAAPSLDHSDSPENTGETIP